MTYDLSLPGCLVVDKCQYSWCVKCFKLENEGWY